MNYGMRFVILYRRKGSRPSPWKRNAKKQNAVWGSLTNSYENKRSEKPRRKGFLISSCYFLELCIQMGISFLFSFAFSFSSLLSCLLYTYMYLFSFEVLFPFTDYYRIQSSVPSATQSLALICFKHSSVYINEPSPIVTINLFSTSVNLFCEFMSIIFLDSHRSYMKLVSSASLHLVWYLWVYPCCCKGHYLSFFMPE